MKRLLWILFALAAVVLVVVIAARVYLTSAHLAGQVRTELEAAYGGPVELAGVDVGVTGSSLHGLQFFETHEQKRPLLSIAQLTTDLSLWQLLQREMMPQQVELSGVSLHLRLDKRGGLLTEFPEAKTGAAPLTTLPRVQIHQGQVSFSRPNYPDFVVKRIEAVIEKTENNLVLTGTAHQELWGAWTLHGQFEPDGNMASLVLKTKEPVHVTQQMLHDLPFVPAYVWDEVQVRGTTPGVITLEYDSASKVFHYRVDLQPAQTTVVLPKLELVTADTHGQLSIDDGVVILKDAEGKVLGGHLHVDGTLDFIAPKALLDFHNITARRLNIRQFPEHWNFPKVITQGELSGKAQLKVTWDKGRPQLQGQGEGKIYKAIIAGQQPEEPIDLQLRASEGGLDWGTETAAESQGEGQARRVPAANGFPSAAALRRELLTLLLVGVQPGAQPPQLQSPQPKKKPTQYLNIHLKLKDVKLQQFLKDLKVELPFRLTGTASLEVKAGIPINTPTDLATYRAEGTATATNVFFADMSIARANAKITYGDGKLILEELQANLGAAPGQPQIHGQAGIITGKASFQAVPVGQLRAELNLKDVSLPELAKALDTEKYFRGRFSASVKASADGKKLDKIEGWNVSGTLTTEKAEVYGIEMDQVAAHVEMAEGQLALSKLQGRLAGAPVVGETTVQLAKAPYPFQGKLNIDKTDLSRWTNETTFLPKNFTLRGQLSTNVQFAGDMQPFRLDISGQTLATNVLLNRFPLTRVQFDWSSDKTGIAAKDFVATGPAGTISGTLHFPLGSAQYTRANLRIQGLDVASVTSGIFGLNIPLEGKVSGTAVGELARGKAAAGPVGQLKMDLQSSDLKVNNIGLQAVTGTLGYHKDVIRYDVQGKALGGTFDADGTYPLREELPAPAGPAVGPMGRLRLQGIQLSQLVQQKSRQLGGPAPVPLVGTLNAQLQYQLDRTGQFSGTGTATVQNYGWSAQQILGDLRSNVRWTALEIVLPNITGSLANGTLSGALTYNLSNAEQSNFHVNLDGVEAERAIPRWALGEAYIRGRLTLRLSGRLGNVWSGGGLLTLSRGEVDSIPISNWSLPFRWSFSPRLGNLNLDVSDSHAHVGSGRATLRGNFTWTDSLSVRGQIRFQSVNVETLLRVVRGSVHTLKGLVTGRIDFSGSNVRSAGDLRATIEATLKRVEPRGSPLLQKLSTSMSLRPSTVFRDGDLRAQLNNGIVHIQKLSLTSDNLQLFIDGNMTLTGRLNLDVTVNVGQLLLTPQLLPFAGARLARTATLPLGVFTAAQNLFSQRLVSAHVTGTLRNPIIQIYPGRILAEEAVRFFLGGVPIP